MQYRNSYLSEMLPDLNLSGKDISLFLREFGGQREEKGHILRIEKHLEDYTNEELLAHQFKFDTIILCTNLEKTAEEVCVIYKERGEIEQAFDLLKSRTRRICRTRGV